MPRPLDLAVLASMPQAMTIEIRLIERPDVASFRECLDTVAREKRYLAMFQAPPHEAVEAFVRRVTDSSSVQWVAVDGTRVVGWADILRHGADAVTHCGRLGMGVLPAYRQQGLGRRLLRAAIASAHARGITRIELDVRSDHAAAIALYEAEGFSREALKRDALRFDGVRFDAVQMSLLQST